MASDHHFDNQLFLKEVIKETGEVLYSEFMGNTYNPAIGQTAKETIDLDITAPTTVTLKMSETSFVGNSAQTVYFHVKKLADTDAGETEDLNLAVTECDFESGVEDQHTVDTYEAMKATYLNLKSILDQANTSQP